MNMEILTLLTSIPIWTIPTNGKAAHKMSQKQTQIRKSDIKVKSDKSSNLDMRSPSGKITHKN